MTRAAIAIALIAILAGTAWPCPGPPPDDDGSWRCAKYDRMDRRLTVAPVQVYVRDEPGALPRKVRKVMRHLTSSGWHSRAGEPNPEVLQLFDAANVPDTYDAIDGARAAFVRDLDRVDGQLRVTLDDGTFVVQRCKERKRMRTCLVRQ